MPLIRTCGGRTLPEATRMQVLALLARLIARSVLAGQEAGGE